jgi:hypothetical protein
LCGVELAGMLFLLGFQNHMRNTQTWKTGSESAEAKWARRTKSSNKPRRPSSSI